MAVLSSAEENIYIIGNIKRENDLLLQNNSVLDVSMSKFLGYLFGGKWYSIFTYFLDWISNQCACYQHKYLWSYYLLSSLDCECLFFLIGALWFDH